jgi:hypothetical protein
VVFALLAVEGLGHDDPRLLTAVDTITVTILLSVIAHGVTARPLAARYVDGLGPSRSGPPSLVDHESGDSAVENPVVSHGNEPV